MGDLKIVINKDQFDRELSRAWSHAVPPDMPMPRVFTSNKSTRLMSFYIQRTEDAPRIGMMICTKKDAKRLVYHRTNRYRLDTKIFKLLGTNLEKEVIRYIDSVVAVTHVDITNRIQKDIIERTKSASCGIKEPGLIAYRRYFTYPENVDILDFFLLTTEKAHELVYYTNNAKATVAASKIDISIDYFTITFDDSGNIQINPSTKFDSQTDTPRFSAIIEHGLQDWETAKIRELNRALHDLPDTIPWVEKVPIARQGAARFYNLRQQRRIQYAINFQHSWINRSMLENRLDIAVLLSEARVNSDVVERSLGES